jgi:CheY-like chemotaxis protein
MDELMDSLRGLRLLILEDDPDLREALGEMFRARGASVMAAHDLETARAIVDDHGAPDLLLADFDLPDGHGAAFAETLRALAPGLRAIALTGHREPESMDRSQAAGFAAHLVKPLEPSTLLAMVRAVTADLRR